MGRLYVKPVLCTDSTRVLHRTFRVLRHSEVQCYKPVQIYSQPNLNLNFNSTQSWNYLLQLARRLLVLLVLSRMKKKIQLLLYLTKKLMHCKSTTLRLLLILRWIKLLLKSLVRPENDGNVLANVLEEEASFDDVDLHQAIEERLLLK